MVRLGLLLLFDPTVAYVGIDPDLLFALSRFYWAFSFLQMMKITV